MEEIYIYNKNFVAIDGHNNKVLVTNATGCNPPKIKLSSSLCASSYLHRADREPEVEEVIVVLQFVTRNTKWCRVVVGATI
jgi:hypothetical protein